LQIIDESIPGFTCSIEGDNPRAARREEQAYFAPETTPSSSDDCDTIFQKHLRAHLGHAFNLL